MYKHYRQVRIAMTCLVLWGIVLTGCGQQGKNEPPISNEPVHETVFPDSTQQEYLSKAAEVETKGNTISNEIYSDTEQQEELGEVQFTFYTSGRNFTKSIIDMRGSVEITDEMREKFNLFARDYRWCYLPDMEGYESFFATTRYTDTFGYTNFADAVFYMLHYMKCPEKMSEEAMEHALQSLFVAKDNSDKDVSHPEKMPHQAYPKFALYEDGYYSPWPEGGLDHNRMFYLLTGLDIVQEGPHIVYITVRAQNYYFEDTNVYEAGENEKWLADKAMELGVPDLQAAADLISRGKMGGIAGADEFETIIYVKFSGRNPYGYDPRIVTNRSRNIAYDEPFSEK